MKLFVMRCDPPGGGNVDCASLDDIPNHFEQPRLTPVLMIIKRSLSADERCFNRQVEIQHSTYM
eukprot:scaffold39082_cov150-Skeletonema_marinoi.AAC.7